MRKKSTRNRKAKRKTRLPLKGSSVIEQIIDKIDLRETCNEVGAFYTILVEFQ